MVEKKYYTSEDLPMPHIGANLKVFFKDRRTHKSVLARILKVNDVSIVRYQKRPSLQCRILWELSLALKHNFFKDLAALMPEDFTTYAPIDTSKDERIAQLEEEVKMLTRERDLLSNILAQKS
jgi:hypothetical protein